MRNSLVLLLISGLIALAPVLSARGAEQPNILVILADDLGWNDVGYHGSPIRTPNLDRLAEQGVELDQFYVHPQCTPTRMGLLTGRQCSRFGIVRPVKIQCLPWNTETLASALKSAGYATGLFGKWHLGNRAEWGPNHYGFDYSYGALPGAVHPWSHQYRPGDEVLEWHRNLEPIEEEGMHAELCTQEALRWLEERPADQPWFLYFPLLSVHTPVDAPVEFKQQYHDRTYFEDPKINESFVRFAAMTTHMDDAIGRLIEAVEARGELENTIIIFFSDNGGVVLEEGRSSGDQYAGAPVLDSWRLGSNEPLRGQKATMWEGGIRVPALVYWQGTLAPRKVETPLSVVDLMPMLLNLAGYEEKRDLKMDGLDIRPTLSGQEQDLSGRAIYIRYIGGMGVVRRGPWKLLKMGTSDFARNRMPGKDRSDRLYNIEEDPLEERNLAAEHPEIVAELNEIYEQNQHLDMPLRDPFVPVFQER